MNEKSLQDAVNVEIARLRPGAAVTASVSGDVVTLAGEVATESDSTVIEQELLGWSTISDVRNHLHVRPPPGEPAAQLLALIEQEGASAEGLRIDVKDGVITLSGQAQSWFDRDAAERVAWMVPGVRGVVNHATLPPGAVEPDDESGGAPVV